MKSLFTLLFSLSVAMMAYGQNLSVTFSAAGSADQVDSVTTINLATGESVSFPGNQTLLLTPKTGISPLQEDAVRGLIYPNPFSGSTTFVAGAREARPGSLKVQNIVGQVIAQMEAQLVPGDNRFELSVAHDGIYLVSLTTDQGTTGYKVICRGSSGSANGISYAGTQSSPVSHGLKSGQTGFTLGYSAGDILLYRCKSGHFITIFTDSPGASQNYPVEFTACTDPGDKNYPVVIIGGQTWMAENLSYLPEVFPVAVGFIEDPYYYVYGDPGTRVDAAKATANYTAYGVLYNWPAAMNGSPSSESLPSGVQGICPTGWHLPSNEEWIRLSDFLGEGGGDKLKETSNNHWTGSNPESKRTTGFNGLPGGFRHHNGTFTGIGEMAFFWSATESAPGMSAYYTGLFDDDGEIYFDDSRIERGFFIRCVKNASTTASLPVVKTGSPTRVTTDTILIGGTVTDEGNSPVSARGICWSTGANPTLDNQKTVDGNGACTFKSSLGGLTPKSIIHLRAYATNSAGTSYGEEVMVTLPEKGGYGRILDIRDGYKYRYTIIGNQTWMAQNLAYLPKVDPVSVPQGYVYFDNNYWVHGCDGTSVAEAKATENYKTFGVLYSFEAAKISCPAGWHNPTDEEWKTMEIYLGMSPVSADSVIPTNGRNSGRVGARLKEMGAENWLSPNAGATDEVGFSARGGGIRWISGFYTTIRHHGYFWTSTTLEDGVNNKGYIRGIYHWGEGIGRYIDYKNYGESVRCVKN